MDVERVRTLDGGIVEIVLVGGPFYDASLGILDGSEEAVDTSIDYRPLPGETEEATFDRLIAESMLSPEDRAERYRANQLERDKAAARSVGDDMTALLRSKLKMVGADPREIMKLVEDYMATILKGPMPMISVNTNRRTMELDVNIEFPPAIDFVETSGEVYNIKDGRWVKATIDGVDVALTDTVLVMSGDEQKK